MCRREVTKHGPQPEWNDFEPTLPQRLAKASAHLVQPASQEDPQVRIVWRGAERKLMLAASTDLDACVANVLLL